MTDKTDDTSTDKGAQVDLTASKRPHATIDVKAKEISREEGAASSDTAPRPRAAPASERDKAAKNRDDNKGMKKEQTQPTPKTGGSGVARFASHLFSGVVGGAIVYAGAHYIPELQHNASMAPTTSLESRLTAMEKTANAKVAEVAKQLTRTEQRLASLGEIEEKVVELTQAQTNLAESAKTATTQPAAGKQLSELEQKLAKLDERLELISRAAGSGTNGVADLAVVTGKVSDLESYLQAELDQLRDAIPSDMEDRFAALTEVSETARSGTKRLDREVAQLRTEAARQAQKDENFRADTARLTAAVDAARKEAGQIASSINEIRSTLDSKVAKPADLDAAVFAMSNRMQSIERNLASIVKSEQVRKQNAERVVLALELANLKRTVDRGQDFSSELAAVKAVASKRTNLAPLEKYATGNLPQLAELDEEFRTLIPSVTTAENNPDDAGIVDRLLASAKSFVQVRRVGHDPKDKSSEAIVGRMEAALKAGQLAAVVREANTLPQPAKAVLEDWLGRVAARSTVDEAISQIEMNLKSSLVDSNDGTAGPGQIPSRNNDQTAN